jgi:anti-sigma regulatory factor (Ser/Thr protein kinase)
VTAIHVRHESTSAGLVRQRVGADLASRGIDPSSIDEVVLVVSELVGNAVRHAGATHGELGIRWEIGEDGVTVEVTDGSTRPPQPKRPTATEPSGRGLQIVAAISDKWGVTPLSDGKRVWAHVPVHAAR